MSGEPVPVVAGSRTLDLNGHGLQFGGINEHKFEYVIGDITEKGGSLAVVDGSHGVEHRYGIEDGQAFVDDGLTANYQTFTGGYLYGEDGVCAQGVTVTLDNITIIGCKFNGIESYGGRVSATNCAVIGCGNRAMEVYGGTITMKDCLVKDNYQGVFVDRGDATLEDTRVSGNKINPSDTDRGAGACVVGGQLTLKGAVEISGNKWGTEDSNLYVCAGGTVKVAGKLGNKEPIGVGVDTPHTFTSGLPGNGGLSNFRSEMPEGEYALGLTESGEAQFSFVSEQVVVPTHGSDVLDLRNEQVGHKVKVYDAGGKEWNYGCGWEGTLTVLPPEGKAVHVTGTVDTEEECDYLNVYEDYGPEKSRMLNRYEGQAEVDETVADDPLTLYFYADEYRTYAGLDLTVEVVDLPKEYQGATKYAVDCMPADHGAVSTDKFSSCEDKVVSVSVKPDEGYLLKSLKVMTEGPEVPVREKVAPTKGTFTFVMPDRGAVVQAEFARATNVTFLDDAGKQLAVVAVPKGGTATAPTVASRQGERLVGWKKDGRLFDLSAPIEEDVSLTAVWKEFSGSYEGFEGSKALPEGWKAQSQGAGYAFWSPDLVEDESEDIQAYSGQGVAMGMAMSGGCCVLASPRMDLSGEANPKVSFAYIAAVMDTDKGFAVAYRVGEGEWQEVRSLDVVKAIMEADLYNLGSEWQQVTLDLPQEACAKDVQIGFKVYAEANGQGPESDDSSYCEVYLDDVMLVRGSDGHRWRFAVEGGSRLAATCENGPEACTVHSATASMELVANDAAYTGDPVVANIKRDDAFAAAHGIDAEAGDVTYFQGERQLDGAPTQAGDYVAKVVVRVGNAQFELQKAFSITPKVVGLKWSGTKLAYDGAKQAPKATATGLLAGDECSVTVAGAAKAAGTHTATATGLSNPNYALPAEATAKFTIAKAKLTVTAKDKKISQGDAPANAGVTYKGFVGSDTAKSLGGRLSFDYGGYRKGGKAGRYEITPKGLSSKNYAIAYKKGTLTVTKATQKLPASTPAAATARVEGKGWVTANEGGVFGTTGRSLMLTGLRLRLTDAPLAGSIQYRSHVQGPGWEKAWSADGATSGAAGKRVEAVRIRLTGAMAKGYDVWYRAHVQRVGWMAWAKDGEAAGTAGMSRRVEALQVVVLRKGSKAPAKDYKGIRQDYAKAFLAK